MRRRRKKGGSYNGLIVQELHEDEGRSFGVGFQEQAPNHSKLLR